MGERRVVGRLSLRGLRGRRLGGQNLRERTLRPAALGTWAVALTALLAGLLFATSAATAQGTDLRAGRRLQLTELIAGERSAVERQERTAASLRARMSALSAGAAEEDSRVAQERARANALAAAAGLTAVTGPAVTVSLNDAPRRDRGEPASDNPDDLVVHQQDVQSVVNALWAGGAEAMSIMGERVISTSAVRCVGNTLILHGRVYGPPFVVTAIGDPPRLRRSLDDDPGVRYFRTFVDRFGLGYRVRTQRATTLPAYDGPLELPHVDGPQE
ncbi:MAG TPA: DUF881 domain-containing protein [Mycobacteriales bacterium]|nr:DUF881 domain-containing protein [Mycobacteriales bacterium]